eukprot:TRINITY_DN38458_c0_g1_i1.p1 TRINITY_DN38458_c0_g1~~TRINITY_DN38458_c0_g1_i1.p1  ORF type:complete len:101 (+),score=19.31 TRINITY_DN38458_c0_g1_i1:74-376(+)
MDKQRFSDLNSTMVANQIFNNILDQIQKSKLNFQLQLSPFDANISLKKTLIKDKSATPVLPTTSSGHSRDSRNCNTCLKWRYGLSNKIMKIPLKNVMLLI